MKKIDDYFNDIPDSLQLPQLMAKGIIERVWNLKTVSKDDYNREGVKEKLLKIFHHKCAYCEKIVTRRSDDIEHFRPKASVVEDALHTGYYWLAYIWSNLLLACSECNRTGAKGNYFPIKNARIAIPDKVPVDFKNVQEVEDFLQGCHIRNLEIENRLFLHPVLDTPSEHLRFNRDGTVTGLTDKGTESIERYGLSDFASRQEDLIKERKAIIEDVEYEVKHAINCYKNDDRLFLDLNKITVKLTRDVLENKPFSAVRYTCLQNFKSFFIEGIVNLDKVNRGRLERAYTKLAQKSAN